MSAPGALCRQLLVALWGLSPLLLEPGLAEVLTPPYFNLAEGREITATATCGDEGPELYCKLVGANTQNQYQINLIQGQVCDTCDLNVKAKAHPPENAVDGMETWWQSPPLSRGMKLNEVNVTINLGQVFHVAYVFLRMGNSPRPGLWALEKSSDYGKTYTAWQYFSDSLGDCETHFGKESLFPISKDDSVICTTEYSKIVPLEGGEIPISLLNNRPSANTYFNSSVLQEWTKATNVRLRLLRTKTLLGHLMSVARQDPTVTRRYFYSIKDISIGGRCMCNGHAQTCDIPDPNDSNKLHCRCQHHTCGAQCETCCTGYEQKAWRQSQHWQKFVCEPCNCFNHSSECDYDANIDAQRLSLDIHGRYEGGGVCKNCMHNTEGINCNKCKARYYRPYDKSWNETDVCQPCDCDYNYSTGNCAEGSGQCECRPEYKSPYCDSCSYGYFGYPNCKPCTCNLNGTDGDFCEPVSSKCPCKYNYDGTYCEECADGFFDFPKCQECKCQQPGSISPSCDMISGNCSCRNSFAGRTCDRCEAGFFNYPECKYCSCDISGTLDSICDNITGVCLCKEGFGGARCDQCIPGYFSELHGKDLACVKCNCADVGSTSSKCDALGRCTCLLNFGGRQCNQCSPGYYNYPTCTACNCDNHGAIGVTCGTDGQCKCRGNFDNTQCSVCKEGYYNFPLCEECNCDPNGVIQSFAGCGSVPAGELCQCKERVEGRICDKCNPLYWNLKQSNEQGCEECECNRAGTQSGIGVCDTKSGQCTCKYSVGTRKCDECQDGTYNLTEANVFGCTDCNCDIGGSVNNICDKQTGQCPCKPRITGLRCNEPISMHFFPTLHQYQYEVEDGTTPSDSPVRYAFSQKDFPNFSWRGYAVFSMLQSEIRQEVQIQKSSVYQMILRYVTPGTETIVGKISITPENPNETEQSFDFLLTPTSIPRFATVSGIGNVIPSPLVMNPGTWHITIKTDKSLYLDYFVLVPAAYYEAPILTQQISRPCVVGNKGLCRHFGYPNISSFDTVRGAGGFLTVNKERAPIETFVNQWQLNELHESNIPLINHQQKNLSLDLRLSKGGEYILLIEYITPAEAKDASGGIIGITIQRTTMTEPSRIFLDSCPYTTPCRQVIIDDQGRIQVFKFQDNYVRLNIDSNVGTSAGIKSVVAIPYDEWHMDYIKPESICVQKKGMCINSEYPIVPDSKKVELLTASGDKPQTKRYNVFNKSVEMVYLDDDFRHIDIEPKVSSPGQYAFIVQYYQPNYPESEIEVLIHNGPMLQAFLPIDHCPSTFGCRSVIQTEGGNTNFSLNENFLLTLKVAENSGVWIDHLLILPASQYTDSLLKENRLDQTREFIETCGKDHFLTNATNDGFCQEAIFSLTSDYNNGALPCGCDYYGSYSFNCKQFGGQCDCKPNIIGRKCEACETGFYGFPECKPCNCPSTALCERETGECICPSKVTGEKCDQCKELTYGFDPIIGCEDCNCDPMGVEHGELQCDLLSGNCSCKVDVIGRACDQCVPGHFSFPDCEQCDCSFLGSTIDICDQRTSECYCKSNVDGPACESCKEGTFNLREDNDAGCTKCFCFGKTTRCNSANLYWSQITNTAGWKIAATPLNNFTMKTLDYTPRINRDITLDFDDVDRNQVIYFEAAPEFLGNKLSSYGGNLNYTIYYTTGSFGSAMSKSDVILHGADIWLKHSGVEQPPTNSYWTKSLPIIETEFVTVDNVPATRELIMTVLENLQGIYIRASYWDPTVMTRLQHIYLDYGVEIWNKESEPANTVEKCECPESYVGNSCEECAEGYYRISSGPHGGYCVPCQCNNHATSCDVNTGICIDCQHDTIGDHCENCIVGYHGNATQKTPNDCLICACPLPTKSNNFARACEFSPEGDEITCDCNDNHIGAQCESCAAGFYGRPTQPGDFCKPCQCSGNINADDPSSCDTITGECLKCMNNTSGEACNLCRPGFYGDAIVLKDCQTCICDPRGMERCDSYTGTCVCKPGVIGNKCDRCEVDHWGFESGNGCEPCNCSVASNSKQCDDTTGRCHCKMGVTGKNCDKCASGFWNFTDKGCDSCGCNKGYSQGFGCNAVTGHCECLRGVIGDRCDKCPNRYVLISDSEIPGCYECDSCVHALLNSTDDLESSINPVIKDFEDKTTGYFTAQRLEHYDHERERLNKAVNELDPNIKDMDIISNSISDMDSSSKMLQRTKDFTVKDADKFTKNADMILKKINSVQEDLAEQSIAAKSKVAQIEQLAVNIEVGEGPRMESALEEARQIMSDIKAKSISAQLQNAEQHLNNATDLLIKIGEFVKPIKNHTQVYDNLKSKVDKLKLDIDDLFKIYDDISGITDDAEDLNENNSVANFESKLKNVGNENNISAEDFKSAMQYLKNASQILDKLKMDMDQVNTDLSDRITLNEYVKKKLDEFNIDENLSDNAINHYNDLIEKKEELENILKESKGNNHTDSAVKAATAYSDIVKEVNDAYQAAIEANDAINNGMEKWQGLENRSDSYFKNSSGLMATAKTLLNQTQDNDILMNTIQSLNATTKDLENNINKSNQNKIKAINDLNKRDGDVDEILKKIDDDIKVASDTSKRITEMADRYKDTEKMLNTSQRIAKEHDDTIKNKEQIQNPLVSVDKISPNISSLVQGIEGKHKQFNSKMTDMQNHVDDLEKAIASAKDLANSIDVGVDFTESTTLQLPLPENVDEMLTNTHVSAYFRTHQPNGFLMYLGNLEGTKLRRTRVDDYMALEILDGRLILRMDIGNGPETLETDKHVANDEWHQVIVDRVGKDVKLTVREELANKTVVPYVSEMKLNGPNTILNLNKEESKLYVGGYPTSTKIQEDLKFNSFEGKIENLVIGDTPVGLWNFIEGNKNKAGAKERSTLQDSQSDQSIFRFQGNSYVKMDGGKYDLRESSSIELAFKTFAKDGLLFLVGNKNQFLSVEIRDGLIITQFRLGGGVLTIGTVKTYNDGQWHNVKAQRYQKTGSLTVDGNLTNTNDADGDQTLLHTSDDIYFGGYPMNHDINEVTKVGFDGCMNVFSLSGKNIDLNKNIQSFGVKHGCPSEFRTLVNMNQNEGGYVKQSNLSVSNDFELIIRFKTSAKDGLIFYATNQDQSERISLSMIDGVLVAKIPSEQLTTGLNTYNDNQWHVVTTTYDKSGFKMNVDDFDQFSSDSRPPKFYFMYGVLYVGGLPLNYKPIQGAVATSKTFTGCVGDAIIYGSIIKFVNATNSRGQPLADCSKHPKSEYPLIESEGPTGPEIEQVEQEIDIDENGISPKVNFDNRFNAPPPPMTTVAPRIPETTKKPIEPTTPWPQFVRPTPKSPKEGCVLGYDPTKLGNDHDGYRFGTRNDSRIEMAKLPDKYKQNYNFDITFNTSHSDGGLMFYASDPSHKVYIAVYMRDGQINYNYNCGSGPVYLVSPQRYNDKQWHTVSFVRNEQYGKLYVDGELVAENESTKSKAMIMSSPFYYGGVPHMTAEVKANLKDNYSPFNGCMKNYMMNNLPVSDVKLRSHVIPCSKFVEDGVYFGESGGHVRLIERFKVGLEFSISMDIRPRNSSGLLVSVHGKKDYLILEIVDNTVVLRVDNGKGAFEAFYKLASKYLLCDGNWHSIQALKSRNIVSVGVDGHFSQAGIGGESPSTDTKSALFIGGHPSIIRGLKGAKVRKGFFGCIRNLKMKDKLLDIPITSAQQDVHIGSCPTD